MRGKKAHLQAAKAEAHPPVVPTSNIWDRLEEVENRLVLRKPPDSFTTAEYAERRGIPISKANDVLQALADRGELTKIKSLKICYWQLPARKPARS